jgi:hypothetical protein
MMFFYDKKKQTIELEPRWRLRYRSRKPKPLDSKNLPEMLEPHVGNSDYF